NVRSSDAMRRRRLSRTLPTVMATLVVLSVAIYTIVVTGPAAHAAATLLSQGKPTTASSTENATFPASAATDGNTGTRWSSAFSDPQWLQVDLGSTATVSQVVLQWEAAYSLWEFQVFGTAGSGGGGSCVTTTNAALNHPATASSTENAGTPASAAV